VDGACFEVHFEKSRGVQGDAVAPFEAKLQSDTHGHQDWSMRTLEDSTYDRVVNLLEDGLSQKDIATELGINKSNVSRHAKRAKAEGRIP
jgi:DNA-binding NarL/FixJ family response regulator